MPIRFRLRTVLVLVAVLAVVLTWYRYHFSHIRWQYTNNQLESMDLDAGYFLSDNKPTTKDRWLMSEKLLQAEKSSPWITVSRAEQRHRIYIRRLLVPYAFNPPVPGTPEYSELQELKAYAKTFGVEHD